MSTPSIASLPVKSLVRVLSELRGGAIGFDPYRDDRTKTKQLLLGFILQNHDNASIVRALQQCSISDTNAYAVSQAMKGNDVNEAIAVAVRAAKDFDKHAVVQEPKPVQSKQQSSEAQQIAALLESLASKASPAVDLATVRKVVAEAIQADTADLLKVVDTRIAELQAPTVVHVHNVTHDVKTDMGLQHRSFPLLLKACQARDASGHRLNIWLHGPAGTGKTYAAHKIADALSLPFQSNGTLLTEHSLSGFVDAHGKYHGSAFREIFEHGGVYLGDEYDVWNPKAAMWLQAALANGYTRFPDGMVKRHADCVIIFGANTVGKGATNDYSTRAKVDDANLNRLVFIEWPLDEALELAVSPNQAWTKRVQKFRARVESRKLKGHMITPRQSLQGAALLAAGIEESAVDEMVLRRGLSEEQWSELQ